MDLSNLYLDAFGLQLNQEQTELVRESYLGTPILQPITFLASKYETIKGYGIRDFGTFERTKENAGKIEIINYADFTLPASSIASFSSRKIINKTAMPDGFTAKEIYGFEDYRITIRGFLLEDPGQPQGHFSIKEQERELIKWDNVQANIPIAGEYFNIREIKAISIESLEFPALRGRPKIRPFLINAISGSTAEKDADSFIEVIEP
jgi:hypothetical protein